jgi:hypothetical protein
MAIAAVTGTCQGEQVERSSQVLIACGEKKNTGMTTVPFF